MQHKITLIKNANIVNEGEVFNGDILIDGEYIKEVDSSISAKSSDINIIDAEGKYLLPGIIDDQVHFREPGLTHKATIETESRAAIAGGITSFIEMPNTNPQTTTIEKLNEKFDIASNTSFANYSFMFGGTNDNLQEILKVDPKQVAALKLFLGSSTGNMLVDNPQVLEKIFSNTKLLIAVHCEDETTIKNNLEKYKKEFGDDIPIKYHPIIRSEEACYLSSSKAIELAKKTGARLHVFHLSTGKETSLFSNKIPLKDKKITAEVCIHHLWFSDEDYDKKGTHIKWNPAVKTKEDRAAIWDALNSNKIDVIATDHAPHTIEEKDNTYFKAPSGGPLVQHAVQAILQKVKEGKMPIERAVEKMSHAVADCFNIDARGYIREGYFADLVVIDPNKKYEVTKENLLYKCGWSPFEGTVFDHTIDTTIVNGEIVFDQGKIIEGNLGKKMTFHG